MSQRTRIIAALLVGLLLLVRNGGLPSIAPVVPVVVPTVSVTAATYVYEKDSTAIPSAVMVGLNRLNRERKIIATLFEEDSTDGEQQVPDQYKIAAAAANESGLPVLVVQAGDAVVRIVKDPQTAEQVWEAAQ